MKITKTQIRNIIKEETAQALSEMYVQPVEGKRTPDEAEVLITGYGGLTIEQIRKKLLGMLQLAAAAAAEDKSFARFDSLVRNGAMMRLYETLVEHNALSPEPQSGSKNETPT